MDELSLSQEASLAHNKNIDTGHIALSCTMDSKRETVGMEDATSPHQASRGSLPLRSRRQRPSSGTWSNPFDQSDIISCVWNARTKLKTRNTPHGPMTHRVETSCRNQSENHAFVSQRRMGNPTGSTRVLAQQVFCYCSCMPSECCCDGLLQAFRCSRKSQVY